MADGVVRGRRGERAGAAARAGSGGRRRRPPARRRRTPRPSRGGRRGRSPAPPGRRRRAADRPVVAHPPVAPAQVPGGPARWRSGRPRPAAREQARPPARRRRAGLGRGRGPAAPSGGLGGAVPAARAQHTQRRARADQHLERADGPGSSCLTRSGSLAAFGLLKMRDTVRPDRSRGVADQRAGRHGRGGPGPRRGRRPHRLERPGGAKRGPRSSASKRRSPAVVVGDDHQGRPEGAFQVLPAEGGGGVRSGELARPADEGRRQQATTAGSSSARKGRTVTLSGRTSAAGPTWRSLRRCVRSLKSMISGTPSMP